MLACVVLPAFGITDIANAKTLALLEGKNPYPYYQYLKVLSPNGGEIWNKNEIQTIKWDIVVAYPSQEKNENTPQILPEMASLDLYQRIKIRKCELQKNNDGNGTQECWDGISSVFVEHIANVKLKEKSFVWKINPDIKNGNDYLIRITPLNLEINFPMDNIIKEKPAVSPIDSLKWDESDGTFTITEKTVPPIPDLGAIIKSLETIRNKMQAMVDELTKVIELLKSLIIVIS